MWGCQNQEKLLIPRCKRCRQSTDAQGRDISLIPTALFLPQKVAACRQLPTTPFHILESWARCSSNTAKGCRTPVLRRTRLVKADAWPENTQEKGESQCCPHTAPTHWSPPGHEMVCRRTYNEYLKGLQKGSVCGERWKREIMWWKVIRNQSRQLPKPEISVNTDYGDMVKIKHNALT